MKSYGYLTFKGTKFSPKKMQNELKIELNQVNEVGDIGRADRVLNFGVGHLDFEGDPTNEFYISNEILDWLESNKAKFVELGIEQITLMVCFEYESQCNLQIPPRFLKRLGDLDIHLLITCYMV